MISTFVLAGVIIGIGVGIGVSQLSALKNILSKNTQGNVAAGTTTAAATDPGQIPGLNDVVIEPVSAGEHVRGATNPKVTFVEYSDPECPFCKRFHEVLKQLVTAFPNDVQWVYRNFPLDIHPKSPHEIVAMECAAEIGGNEIFWQYLDRLNVITPANNGLDPKELDNIAAFVKLDKSKFSECLKSNKFDAKIAAQTEEAIQNGGDGTPFSIVLAPNGKQYKLKGAVDYQPLANAVQKLLAEGKK